MTMRLIKAKEVQELTGLSADQLREWTNRRGLIAPDVPPQGSGTNALYAWQTVLVLRLAVVLRTKFHVELQSHRELLAQMRQLLEGVAFHALWGTAVALRDMAAAQLVDERTNVASSPSDLILLRLDPHLETLSRGFALEPPMSQLPLFPAIGVQ